MSLAPSPSLPYFFSDFLYSSTATAIIVIFVSCLVVILVVLCWEFCFQTSSMNSNVPAPDIALALPRNPRTPQDVLARYIELVLQRDPALYIDALVSDIELGLQRNPTAVERQEEPNGNNVEIVYKSQESEGHNGMKKECCVCLEEFRDGERCMVLACNHSYHRDCINMWFRRSRHCPLCRELVQRSFH